MATEKLFLAESSNSSDYMNSSCLMFPSNPEHCDVINIVRNISAALSLIACVLMLGIIWLFKKYVVFAQRLITYLTVAAFLESLAYLASGNVVDGGWCNFQAGWLTFSGWSVLLWTLCLTFNLYMNVIKEIDTRKYEWVYLLLCWLISFVISCIPYIWDKYGPAGAFCWIVEDWGWRFGIWYLPLVMFIILLIVSYGRIVYVLRKKASSWEGTYNPDTERSHKMLKEDIKPLKFYPFVYLAVSVFPLINRLQNAISPNNNVFGLVLLASIAGPLHGTLNAVVFGMDKTTRDKLTRTQIQVALQTRWHHDEVREYPVTHRVSDPPPTGNIPFQHISYSKLY
ncbi:cyclic AMP receptor-like protein A isoform X2 [Gigantopelta aegis]|uniref:cyclic AMP receptor-like protein A isoform X2 n=1 Tax=Gigantopelta aegis TaxID=1735272 RepID=UPI001B88A358|nr:cyclic AMP receptor-like protein A isoform X2 [Gigantopelta aegis]